MRGQERAWLRCIDMTIGPAWAEVSRAAMACRSRNANPPCWIWPCLARISSLARACCKARESWLAGGPCQRGSTFKGNIWGNKGKRNRSVWQWGDSIAAWNKWKNLLFRGEIKENKQLKWNFHEEVCFNPMLSKTLKWKVSKPSPGEACQSDHRRARLQEAD